MLDGLTADRLDAAMQGGWRAFADRGERIRSTPARPLTGLPLRFEGPRPKANRPKAGLARGGEARLRRHETPSYRSQIELTRSAVFTQPLVCEIRAVQAYSLEQRYRYSPEEPTYGDRRNSQLG